MEAYAQAKAKLFAWNDLKCRVVNLDDDFGRQLAAEKRESRLITYSLLDSSAYLYCREAQFDDHGVRATLVTPQGEHHLRSTLLGRFNLSNVLAAVGALLGLDYSLDEILKVLPKLEGRPDACSVWARHSAVGGGRLRPHPGCAGKSPDGFAPTRQRQCCACSAAAGDRDRGKRPLRPKVVERLADQVLSPMTIRAPKTRSDFPMTSAPVSRLGKVTFVAGRGQAIAQLIADASADDVIVLAGKGHEDYQEINGERHAFSDLSKQITADRLGCGPC